MTAMNFRNEANRLNAQKSTGPKTEEGKARSRANALRHGLSALIVAPDVNPREVDAARKKWIDCFNPQDEVALTLADMAFRCKRRMETVADAEDAANAIRVRELATSFKIDIEREHRGDLELFRNEPNVGHIRLLQSDRGCAYLLDELAMLEEKLAVNFWEEADGLTLLGIEGKPRDGLDTELKGVQDLFDSYEEIRGMAEESPACAALARSVAKVSEGLRDRIERLRGSLEERRAYLNRDLGDVLQLRSALAKFDPTDDGRLRRRYLIDAQREFLKALGAATRVAGPKLSPESVEVAERAEELAAWNELSPLPVVVEPDEETEPETEVEAEPEPGPVVAEGPPNEPRSRRIGRSGRNGRKARRLPAPRPRRVDPPVADGPGL